MCKISYQENFIENKLKECIGKPKDFWKAIKSLGLRNKSGGCIVGAFAENQIVKHDTKSILKAFIQILQGIYCQNLQSCQIDIQLILSLITVKNFHYLKICLKTDCLSYWKMLRSQKKQELIKFQEDS